MMKCGLILVSIVTLSLFSSVHPLCRVFKYITQYDSEDPTVLIADHLPLDVNNSIEFKVMPYVGNGHLAATIFNNQLYVNGLYNGEEGESHRARLPNIHRFRLISPQGDFLFKQYVLDMKNGVFVEQLEDEEVVIERKIFAHQYYTRLMVTHVTVRRKETPEDAPSSQIVIQVDYQKNYTSEDLTFQPIEDQTNYRILRGKTNLIEFGEFQKELRNVFMYFTEPVDLVLEANENMLTRVFLSSIDVNEAPARDEFNIVAALDPNAIYELHASKFANLWNYGRIETDNFEIQSNIYSSYYYMLSSLPSTDHYGSLNPFYGLSPGSLSRGFLYNDYQGHSFWDTETWMYPSILMFYPNIAKDILSYRINFKEANVHNAELFNTSGWRFPWESAYTGLDVTPDCCPQVRLYQLHINGDIAFAARQYYSLTRDNKWLNSEGGNELISKLAEFWASRITYSTNKRQFEILGVLPPDEDATPNVNNSVFTNIIASLSIHYANYTTCLTSTKPLAEDALRKARCLHIPFDSKRQIHLEYEGYVDKEIKQADVVLIGFPLMWPMDPQIRKNDLLYYENKTRINGPAMTWGMHSIGFIELGEHQEAADLLHRSYSRYVKEPFNTWTEAYEEVGAVNFITGAGGFLQTLIFGYGGLRLHAEDLRLNGKLPLLVNSSFLYLHRIKYLGASLSFNYTQNEIAVIVNSLGAEHPLELLTNNRTYDLKAGDVLRIAKIDFEYSIRSKVKTNCPLPYDKIDLPTCDSLVGSSSDKLTKNILVALFLTLFALLLNF